MDYGRLERLRSRAGSEPRTLVGRWLRRRAVLALLNDGSAESMDAVIAVLRYSFPDLVWASRERTWLLERIALCKSPAARDAVCRAWVAWNFHLSELEAVIADWRWVVREPLEMAVSTALLAEKTELCLPILPDCLPHLLKITLHCSATLAKRAHQLLVQLETAKDRKAVCEHFLRHDDPGLGEILADWGYEPDDAIQQVLLYFLSGQWQRYEEIDPDHRLLRTNYEMADPALRSRIMDYAIRAGRQEWVSVAVGGPTGERLGQMSEQEWANVLQMLVAKKTTASSGGWHRKLHRSGRS